MARKVTARRVWVSTAAAWLFGFLIFLPILYRQPAGRDRRPGFVGAHRLAGADVSSKVVRKRDPGEKVGVVAERDGRQLVIEYSDLPEQLAALRRPDGGLAFCRGQHRLARVRARVHRRPGGVGGAAVSPGAKPVPYVDEHGHRIDPIFANAVKFEQFIFDTLPLARRSLVLETEPGGRVRAAQERLRARPRPRRCGSG